MGYTASRILGPSNEQLRLSLIQDNKRVFASITSEHIPEGASPLSRFIPEQLPPLNESDRPYKDSAHKTKVQVINGDSLVIARELMDDIGDDARGKTAVLNLASDEHPGGGWEHGSVAQEECLCYSSTLFHTLCQADTLVHYPWPNTGPGSIAGIFSEGVVIFRGPLNTIYSGTRADVFQNERSNDGGTSSNSICPLLPHDERKVISVISVAAPRYPKLTSDGNDFADEKIKEEFKEKVRLVLRIGGHEGKRYLVLGAMGCGAYFCPPLAVARLMKNVLIEPEFRGWFARIVSAVFSPSGTLGIGVSNFEVFKDVLNDMEL
ncbi:hypothetical protein F5890DRAFT_589279 [Lentinula detonsa]|uniref:Microbial-type PARG catalytic domain-containing protein n=1 Tax=Lentinula detonsa TaxID=2804962 RepID=A0AA38PTN1_9AGAR|nr:hypothetical protein F5890DRAFT_589279 [Lentinula detonsa]